ncbi:hypothetical protein ABPG77_011508 [Micractinium sp. CCAP 211/92]
MQAVARTATFGTAVVAKPAATRQQAVRAVVCRAQQQQNLASKAAAAAVSLPAFLAAHPAFALVDDRMNGDGTGKILGINDPVLFWVLAGVFTTVWAVYYVSTKDIDTDVNDDDYGLKL